MTSNAKIFISQKIVKTNLYQIITKINLYNSLHKLVLSSN